jgi:hypothetical protein
MENDSVEIWIASVCSSPLAVIFLKEAILSALKQKINLIVRVFLYTQENINILSALKEIYKEKFLFMSRLAL